MRSGLCLLLTVSKPLAVVAIGFDELLDAKRHGSPLWQSKLIVRAIFGLPAQIVQCSQEQAMKKLESAIGIVSGIAASVLALYALGITGVLIYKGPAGKPPPAVGTAVKPVQQAADTLDDASKTLPPVGAQSPAPASQVTGVDLKAGENAFKACKACHNAAKGGKNVTGPNLWGIVGRPIASIEGFKYSDAMASLSAQAWDAAALEAFLADPKGFAKGTKMAYAGLKNPADRANLIAWLGQQSDTPIAVAAAVTGQSAPEPAQATSSETQEGVQTSPEPYADLADDAVVTIDPVPYPEGVTYRNPQPLTEEERLALAAKVAELEALVPTLDYERARYHPLHFPPASLTASSEECLVCHKEIIDHKPRVESPAGVKAENTIAWYQTLDTYEGAQADFHWRHIESDFAKSVMKLECNFCHKGNDPREESPDMTPTRAAFSAPKSPEFTLRKMVNPSETCLLCHGAMPDPVNIMGLSGPWHEARVDLETPEAPNGCLSCHAESFRTNRHQVDYLNAETIEELARNGTSDTCYGCHGGRAWYRISYPYPRTPWPGMDTETTPDWAVGRPTKP